MFVLSSIQPDAARRTTAAALIRQLLGRSLGVRRSLGGRSLGVRARFVIRLSCMWWQLLFKRAQGFFILVYIDFYLSNRPTDAGDTCVSKHLGNLVAAIPIPTATDDFKIALAVNDMGFESSLEQMT